MDPPMPAPSLGTKQHWIDAYNKEEKENRQQLLALIRERNLHQENGLGNNNLHLPVILPE
eukprot:2300385-Ditylum_brightwellii.AAC.1